MAVDLHKCGPHCTDYCFACNRHEPVPPDYHRICIECFHVYVTEQELIDGHNAILKEIADDPLPAPLGSIEFTHAPPVTSGEQVFCCPKCIHDF